MSGSHRLNGSWGRFQRSLRYLTLLKPPKHCSKLYGSKCASICLYAPPAAIYLPWFHAKNLPPSVLISAKPGRRTPNVVCKIGSPSRLGGGSKRVRAPTSRHRAPPSHQDEEADFCMSLNIAPLEHSSINGASHPQTASPTAALQRIALVTHLGLCASGESATFLRRSLLQGAIVVSAALHRRAGPGT